MGQAILYEDFNYTPPAYVGGNGAAGTSSNNWTTHSVTTGQTTTIDVLNGNLSYTGLATSSGNKIFLPGTNSTVSRDINRAIVNPASTVAYYSVLVKVIDVTQLSTSFDYFLSFGGAAGSSVTSLGARLGIKSSNGGANFRFGVGNNSGGTGNPVYTEVATDLTFGLTYLVVVKFDRAAIPTLASMWVNPSSLGSAEPAGAVTNATGTNTFASFSSICVRNGSGTPKAELDEIRVGTTWADVTPVGTIAAPTTQTSNFTFTNVLQTQMDVAWTPGNGGKRVVKISTSGTILAPADGTDPSASTVYSGSGEQVIYNGGGSTIPTVTNLTTGTTYWFQSWEYNGTGASTLYCTAVGANNPKSQVTASTATPPVVSTPTFASVTATGALLGGTVVADGGSAITERGTVWSTTSPVTIADHKVAEGGTTTGTFTHTRTGMPPNTLIYFAAYAENSAGPSLTSELSFTTLLAEPTNHVDAFAAVAPGYSSVVNTWLDNDGLPQSATGYLILANTTGVFVDPVDGLQPAADFNLGDGSGLVYVNHGIQTYTWTGLNSLTQYYFAIYPYTNSGLNIDYKTTVTVPTASATTLSFVNLAAWTFDATPASPSTPTSAAANYGDQSGIAMLYADGTNGSSSWLQASELTTFGGTTLNDPRGVSVLAGNAYTPLGGLGTPSSANGKWMIFKFSMTALQNAELTMAVRGTATGFNTHQWAWSTNGTNYTIFGPNTADNSGNFVLKSLDLSTITQLNGAPDVYLKITFTGATSSSGNNRLDNIVIRASVASSIPPTVATLAATSVGAVTATLNGTVNANNQSTAATFEYGYITGTYGQTIAAVPATVTGGTTTSVLANLTGLIQNTTYYYRISGTNNSGTANGGEQFFTTGCLFPEDAGPITGPETVCAGPAEYQYSVEPVVNATGYVWLLPPGASFVAGEGTHIITVTFAPGNDPGVLHVYGTNDCAHEGNESQLAITVNQPLAVSVSIAASANPVSSGTSVTFTATPVNGGVTPQYLWKVNNVTVPGATGTAYTYVPLNNDVITCVLTSSVACSTGNPATSNAITMVIITGPPAELTVTGTVSSGQTLCYDATTTITVAGGITVFEVLSGGSATMIAGQNIIYLPGAKVNSGGYLHGYIAPGGPYCSAPPAMPASQEETGLMTKDNSFKIYPNPTSGAFTIEQTGEKTADNVKVEVLGTLGGRILSTDIQGNRKQELSIKGNPPGIYFVKIMTGDKVQTVKIILTN